MATSCTLKLDIDVVFQLVSSATKQMPGTAYGVVLGSRPSPTEMQASELLNVPRLGTNTAPLFSTLRAVCGDCDPVAYFVTTPGHIHMRDETFTNTCKNCLKNLTDGNQGIDFVFLLTLDPYLLEFGILALKAFTLNDETNGFEEAHVEISPGPCEMMQLYTLLKDTPSIEYLIKAPVPNVNALMETISIYTKQEHECADPVAKEVIRNNLTALYKIKDELAASLKA